MVRNVFDWKIIAQYFLAEIEFSNDSVQNNAQSYQPVNFRGFHLNKENTFHAQYYISNSERGNIKSSKGRQGIKGLRD